MLDQLSIENLIRQQIATEVDNHVTKMLCQEHWLENIEQRIIQHVQDRITARFANIESVPDLIATVKNSVVTLMDQGHIPGVSDYVDPVKIQQAVDMGVESFVATVIDNLSIDQSWLQKIQTQIDHHMTQRVLENLSSIDLRTVFATEIDRSLGHWKNKLQQNFSSQGIKDSASSLKLEITDDQTKLQNCLQTATAEITGTLTTNNLVVKGVINTDNASWDELVGKIARESFALMSSEWEQSLVRQVLDLAKTENIDFKSVSLQGSPLVANGALSEHVTHSHLSKVGNLESLTVVGHSSINDTLDVSRNRVGINTDKPEMALSVWDEEVAISLGKFGKQQAYIGTSRKSNLVIGINRQPAIEIDTECLTTVQGLRIQRHRIAHAAETPGYNGTRGDFVLNSDPKPNTPFAWVCLGGFKWQPLRSA
jgi:hypothetical protein